MGMKIEGEHKRQRQLNRLLERIHLGDGEDCRISFQEGSGFRVKREGSEISDFILKIKNNEMYELLKEDYVFGNELNSIVNTFGLSSLVAEMAVYTATEIPSRCIESLLEYEMPQQLLKD